MDRIIQWSITNRLFVVIASIGLLVYGVFTVRAMPVDVFPDLTAPTVTVATTARVARVANQGRRREELGMRPTSLADAATGVAPPG